MLNADRLLPLINDDRLTHHGLLNGNLYRMRTYRHWLTLMTLLSLCTFAAPSEAAWWKRSKAPARDIEAQNERGRSPVRTPSGSRAPSPATSKKDSARSKKERSPSVGRHRKHLRDSFAHIDHAKALGVVAGLTATAAVATEAAGQKKATAALKCVSGVCATLAGAKGVMSWSAKEKAKHAERAIVRRDRGGGAVRPARAVRRTRATGQRR